MLKREVDPVTRVVIERKIAFLSTRRSAFIMLKERLRQIQYIVSATQGPIHEIRIVVVNEVSLVHISDLFE